MPLIAWGIIGAVGLLATYEVTGNGSSLMQGLSSAEQIVAVGVAAAMVIYALNMKQ